MGWKQQRKDCKEKSWRQVYAILGKLGEQDTRVAIVPVVQLLGVWAAVYAADNSKRAVVFAQKLAPSARASVTF